MVYCQHCNRWFKNKQALRAHLRFCPLKKEEIKEENTFEKLLLRFLVYVCNLDEPKSKFSPDELTKALKCDKETLDKFFEWYKKHPEYRKIVITLIEAKKKLKGG